MRFAIEGQIDSVGAADIFLFLSQTRRTSVVAFERPDQETRVFFVDGQPVWCCSSKVQLQLESRLAVAGTLKPRDVEAALSRQKAGPNRLPQTLIAESMATEALMEHELRDLSLETLRDVATWTTGTFTVYDGVIPPPWIHTISPDFPALLIEALRGQCQKETLQKEFVSRKGILRARPVSGATPGINDAERAILLLANGERTVEDLVKRSGLDEQQALCAMHVLFALRLAELLPAPRSSRPVTEKVVPAPSPVPSPVAAKVEAKAPEKAGAPDKSVAKPEAKAAEKVETADQYVAKQAVPAKSAVPKEAAKAAAAPPAEVTPKASDPDSTSELPVLQKTPTRSLRIVSEDKTDQVVLTKPIFAVGRHPRNDLVLKDPRISSFHCRIEVEGDKHVIVDLKSRNGTLLNSARIDRAVLKHNDQIQLGSTKISFIENP